MTTMTAELASRLAQGILRQSDSEYAVRMAEQVWPDFRANRLRDYALDYLTFTYMEKAGVEKALNKQAQGMVSAELRKLLLEHLSIK